MYPLPPIENVLDDGRRQEREIKEPGDIAVGETLAPGDLGDRSGAT
jgi:hypothetical protein